MSEGLTYCFDLDLTLCFTSGTSYEFSSPYTERINRVNKLYLSGNKIIIFTARGTLSGEDYSTLTRKQLLSWGLLFHELIFGKPYADFYVDDKAISSEDFKW
jgi:hypothetical protein